MGNLFEILKKMKDGEIITGTAGYVSDIKKDRGAFIHVNEEGETLTHYGTNGYLINFDGYNVGTWKIKKDEPEYIEIDLLEVKARLQAGKVVYMDHDKKEIYRYTDLADDWSINDFEDVFVLTAYYKKKGE